jgi:hypothetical protein
MVFLRLCNCICNRFGGRHLMTTRTAPARGLVSISTSDTRFLPLVNGVGHLVDSKAYRVKKVSHSVKTTARLHQQECTDSGFRYKPAMITCTYAEGQGYNPRDITNLIKNCRNYLARQYKQSIFRYTWVAELTKRGIPHYHLILWLPKGCSFPKPDKRGWWTKGMTKIEWVKNAFDIAKYFPKGLRISGYGGLSQLARREYRYWRVPASIRALINPNEKPPAEFDLRKIKDGYFNKDTGEFIESSYQLVTCNGSFYICSKEFLKCA